MNLDMIVDRRPGQLDKPITELKKRGFNVEWDESQWSYGVYAPDGTFIFHYGFEPTIFEYRGAWCCLKATQLADNGLVKR